MAKPRGGGKCATVVLAIGVHGLVEALNAGLTQHHETPVKFCRLVFAQNGFRIRSARREKQDIIFAFCSLFERAQRKATLIVVH
jgi:hypothetical protein